MRWLIRIFVQELLNAIEERCEQDQVVYVPCMFAGTVDEAREFLNTLDNKPKPKPKPCDGPVGGDEPEPQGGPVGGDEPEPK